LISTTKAKAKTKMRVLGVLVPDYDIMQSISGSNGMMMMMRRGRRKRRRKNTRQV
jgi:hypothetical protein